jgi:taurine transport system substrate-binding protein
MTGSRISRRTMLATTAAAAAALAAPAIAQAREVTFAYQDMVIPWRVAQAAGELEKATGFKVNYRQFGGGGDVIRAMASGDVKIGEAGSSPIAAALAQGLPLQLYWILEDIADSEVLVVRNGSGITTPQDLRGKRIGVPFVSTTHFHLMFALQQFGIPANAVRVLNMRPPEIAAAWERGDIDATFIWNPVLARVRQNGRVLVSSGLLTSWGRATFDGMVVDRAFAQANPEFMVAMVKIFAAADEAYRRNPAEWLAAPGNVAAVARLSGAKPEDVAEAMALYRFPTLAEQASPTWLGGGAEGGAARALKFTAEFLKEQGRVNEVPASMAGSVTDEWVRRAMA